MDEDGSGAWEPGFSRNALAAQWNVDRHTAARRLRDNTGEGFRQFRRQALVAEAMAMLAKGLPVKVVALDLGFRSARSFCRFFKRATGITATAARGGLAAQGGSHASGGAGR